MYLSEIFVPGLILKVMSVGKKELSSDGKSGEVVGIYHIESRLAVAKTLTSLLLREIESLLHRLAASDRRPAETTGNLTERVQRYEIVLICNALLESNGNQTKAAKQLGMKNSTLHAKIRRYKIDPLSLFAQFPDATDSDERIQQME